jgi:hypothetical protein
MTTRTGVERGERRKKLSNMDQRRDNALGIGSTDPKGN